MDNWMIMYQLINGKYEPLQYGSNLVPTSNIDKVIQVPEEIARQGNKFDYDGEKLIRKKDQYILTLEELREKDKQEEISLYEGSPPHIEEQNEINKTQIQF